MAGKKVAIKKFIPRASATAEKYRNEFDNEVKLHDQCTYPHIVVLLAICIENKRALCSIQEYVEGGDLRHVLKYNNPQGLSSYTLWTIMGDIASALNYIHAHNIVHNDIKPENILLTKENRGKITDFGISSLNNAETSAGTSQYMAPECYQKPHKRRRKSDVYSLGMVMWEVWCGNGKTPFSKFVKEYQNMHPKEDASLAMRSYIKYKNGTEVIPQDTPDTRASIIKDCWKREDDRPVAATLLWSIFAAREKEQLQITSTSITEATTAESISPNLM